MVEVWVPYGNTEICATIPAENYAGSWEARTPQPCLDYASEIKHALANPLGTPRLVDIAKQAKNVVILVNDSNHVEPFDVLLGEITSSLVDVGVDASHVTVILGRGQEQVELEEAQQRIGKSLPPQCRLMTSTPHQREHFIETGTTSLKTKVLSHRILVDSDLRIAVGSVGFHPTLGFSGGSDDIVRTSTASGTLRRLYSQPLHPESMLGNLDENSLQREIMEAAGFTGVNFHVDFVLDAGGKILRIFAGETRDVFQESVKFLRENCTTSLEWPVDIALVSAGGAPRDDDFFSAFPAIENILGVLKKDGVVILTAECPLGGGVREFHDLLVRFKSPEDLSREATKDPPEMVEAALRWMRITERTRVICVTVMPEYLATGVFRVKVSRTLNDALASSFRMAGRNSRVAVFPQGANTFPQVKTLEATATPPTTRA